MGSLNPIIPDALGPLNQAHGLANGLQSAIRFDARGKPVDLVNPERAVTVSNYAFDGTIANGPLFKAGATSGYISFSPVIPVVRGWTISVLCRFPIDNNATAVFASNAGPTVYHALRNISTDALASYSGGFVNFAPTIAIMTLTGVKRLTITGDASGCKAYLDGAFVGSHSTVITASITQILGQAADVRAWGAAKDAFFWIRTLGPAEVMDHALDPWAMFRADDSLMSWLIAIAGGNTPTNITLAQASWLWTGQAITIDAKTMIALAQGAWTWTGRTAAINARNMITLAQGVWRWTGIPIGGLVNDVLSYLLGLLGVGL